MRNAMWRETGERGSARGAAVPGWPVAGKTGTSEDFRDAWFVGFTSQLVTGVWLGNDDNTPTKRITGGGLPVEVWSQFMRAAHRGKSPPLYPPPLGDGDAMAAFPNAHLPAPPAGVPGLRAREAMRPGDGAPPPHPPPLAGEGRGGVIDRLFSRRCSGPFAVRASRLRSGTARPVGLAFWPLGRHGPYRNDVGRCHGHRAMPWHAPCQDRCGRASAKTASSGSFPRDGQPRGPRGSQAQNAAP